MTHLDEDEFRDRVAAWYRDRDMRVATEVYQPGPYWFADIVVTGDDITRYIEVENDADSIRAGVGQAIGYAGADPNGVPMVVVPNGHTESPDVQRLRQGSRVIVRAFDAVANEWV